MEQPLFIARIIKDQSIKHSKLSLSKSKREFFKQPLHLNLADVQSKFQQIQEYNAKKKIYIKHAQSQNKTTIKEIDFAQCHQKNIYYEDQIQTPTNYKSEKINTQINSQIRQQLTKIQSFTQRKDTSQKSLINQYNSIYKKQNSTKKIEFKRYKWDQLSCRAQASKIDQFINNERHMFQKRAADLRKLKVEDKKNKQIQIQKKPDDKHEVYVKEQQKLLNEQKLKFDYFKFRELIRKR